MITYKNECLGADVYLENKLVGRINMTSMGLLTYTPKGNKGCTGEYFETIEECKSSIEGEIR